ncbi:hypothetical protein [Bifidobacterium saguinibicoloris]|uniref:hypothetical protein n=1 Tax=Bifidobacterium saguinibicoloris TaxID=2834433 RepID=UPI001C59F51E|nr:hypothetical protein [Bifidobacterium saguinibicoloris]MBW3080204.1 hypothetical protein [Bifidobacterium saguinibicoloris]
MTMPHRDTLPTLPAFVEDAALDDVETKAMERLQGLIDAHALDSAHGDIMDDYVANLAAPVYQRAERAYHDGLRILDRSEGDLVGRLSRSRSAADAAADASADLSAQYAAVYEECLALRRVHGGVDWRTRLGWWRARGWEKAGDDRHDTAVAAADVAEPPAGDGDDAGACNRRNPTEPCARPWPLLLFLACGLLAELADPIMSASLFDALLNMPGTTPFGVSPVSCVIVGSVVAGTIGIPLAVGWHAARRRPGNRDAPSPIHLGLAVFWGLLGASMALLRIFEAQIEGVRANYASSVPFGLFMLVVYVLAGLDLFATSHAYFSGTYHRMRGIQRAAVHAERRRAARLAETERLVRDMTALDDMRGRFTRERDRQFEVLHEREDAIKRLIRLQLAQALADPAQSALVRTPLRPTRPVRTPSDERHVAKAA